MKICSKCEIPKEESEFHIRTNGKICGHCKECQRLYCREHYRENKESYITNTRNREKEYIDIARKYVVEYLNSHPCVDCGESDIVVLQFDHVNGDKRNNISGLFARSCSLRLLKSEIEKCEIRCANCHVRRTSKQFGFWKERLTFVIAG